MQMESEGDRVSRSGIRAKRSGNGKGKDERSTRMANTKKGQGCAEVSRTCQLL